MLIKIINHIVAIKIANTYKERNRRRQPGGDISPGTAILLRAVHSPEVRGQIRRYSDGSLHFNLCLHPEAADFKEDGCRKRRKGDSRAESLERDQSQDIEAVHLRVP